MTNRSNQPQRPLTVLAVFAHPDDEGFGCGGTLAALVAGGHRVTLVCATNGEVGEISDPALASPATLGPVRQGELRAAMDVTGVQDVRFLNYRDSGMAGTDANSHPASLFQAPPQRVTAQVADVIRELRPDVVITHDPTGGYGHPDHITICHHTTAAVANCHDAVGPMLYYLCFPRSVFQRMWREMESAGIRPPFSADDTAALGTADDAVTTVRKVGRYLAIKKESLECHRTQIDPGGPFAQLSPEFVDDIMSTEYFQLVDRGGETRDILAELPED